MPVYEIIKEGQSEIIRKKSKFLGLLLHVSSEQEALDSLSAIKKEHYNARHNCYAYVIDGQMRSSDDGEPAQTAGKQIADTLEHMSLDNALCVVTRYFGGVLLGTGGLSAAYRDASLEAAENAVKVERLSGIRYHVSCSYNDYGKIEYFMKNEKLPVMESLFTDSVSFDTVSAEDLKKKLSALTEGRASVTESGPVRFATDGEKVLLF